MTHTPSSTTATATAAAPAESAPTPGTSLITTLPGPSYTDPDIFRQEQEKIFERCGSARCAARTWKSRAPSVRCRSAGRAS